MILGAVILAAGSGMRLGGVAKALLRAGDDTYLERIVRVARAAGTTEIVVVVGPPHREAVADAARQLAVIIVENPEPSRGMASSVALGFGAISVRPVEAAWLWPVDHPFVAEATLATLLGALATHEVAQPRYAGRGGHPPLIARARFAALTACDTAPRGARDVIAASDTVAVSVDDPAVVRDVDTPADLAEVG